jgi:hypothetical protein
VLSYAWERPGALDLARVEKQRCCHPRPRDLAPASPDEDTSLAGAFAALNAKPAFADRRTLLTPSLQETGSA